MRGQVLLAAAFAASSLGLAQPAAAQNYPSYNDAYAAQSQQCQQTKTNRTVGGAILGGLAGAILGSHTAARGHRSDGALLGAAVGAAAGGAIGNSSARHGGECQAPAQGAYDPYYGQPYGQQGGYDGYRQGGGYDDGSGLDGGPYPSSYGHSRGRDDCRWGEQIIRDPNGYERRQSVYMCRGRDGVWRTAQR
ncbi:MAG TPA: YMGG-like glycine zipper-containing protein [Caulobacterales bacterium]|nr:YMGG-like glycine zipper-containing protein [Caulobacterales bacterium]